MTQNRSGKIISLTYHEITRDPRVLKQARVLQNAGYDVRVFCDWPEGMPEHDEIDGVQITRFVCYGPQNTRADILEELGFLDRSRDEICKRYLPVAEAAEALENLNQKIETKFGPDAAEKFQSKQSFTDANGEPRRGSVKYLLRKARFKLFGWTLPVDPVTGEKPRYASNPRKEFRAQQREYRAHRKDFRERRRELYQASSVQFCSNFPKIEREDGIVAVHAHDIYCLPAGVMLSKRLDVPLIYDAHEYEPARGSNKMDEKNRELPEWIEDDCFPHVSRIITVSDGIGDLYAERFTGPPPSIVMNAPELDGSMLQSPVPVRAGLKTVREQVNLSEEDPLIVFTGGIQRTHRGLDKVLEAMVHLPEAHLVSLGPRHDANDAWFEDIAKKLAVRDRVYMLPPVDARDVPAAISTAHVSIIPIQDVSLSYRYCMPNKLFEAAFAGIPVCVSNLPELSRFVETLGSGVVVDQTDPKSIATGLQEVFNNRNAYLMTPAAEKTLMDHYSWQRQADKLMALYDEILVTASTSI